MGQQPFFGKPIPTPVGPLFGSGGVGPFCFMFPSSSSSAEDEKELLLLEQEVREDMERIEDKHYDKLPIGTDTDSQVFAEEDDEGDGNSDAADDDDSSEIESEDSDDPDELFDDLNRDAMEVDQDDI